MNTPIVELKKVKITKSIIDQSLLLNWQVMSNWNNYDILGFCVIKNTRIVLLYNRVNQVINKCRFVDIYKKDCITIEDTQQQFDDKNGGYIFRTGKKICINFTDLNNSITLYQSENETLEDITKEFEKIKEFHKIVNQNGQIYI